MIQYKVRTQIEPGTDSTLKQKFAARFTAFRPISDVIAWTSRSAFVFDTVEEAEQGAVRAVDLYLNTGLFPNMCERF